MGFCRCSVAVARLVLNDPAGRTMWRLSHEDITFTDPILRDAVLNVGRIGTRFAGGSADELNTVELRASKFLKAELLSKFLQLQDVRWSRSKLVEVSRSNENQIFRLSGSARLCVFTVFTFCARNSKSLRSALSKSKWYKSEYRYRRRRRDQIRNQSVCRLCLEWQ